MLAADSSDDIRTESIASVNPSRYSTTTGGSGYCRICGCGSEEAAGGREKANSSGQSSVAAWVAESPSPPKCCLAWACPLHDTSFEQVVFSEPRPLPAQPPSPIKGQPSDELEAKESGGRTRKWVVEGRWGRRACVSASLAAGLLACAVGLGLLLWPQLYTPSPTASGPNTASSQSPVRQQTAPPAAPQTVDKVGAVVAPPASGFQRTVILMRKPTVAGEDVFFRGGGRDGAPIPIVHKTLSEQVAYNAWKVGDSLLSWGAGEDGQGSHQGKAAEGTPAVWTTNDTSNERFWSRYNDLGDHYWLVELDMDCGATDDGWFQLKGFVLARDGGWETLGEAQSGCAGELGSVPASFDKNWDHLARCEAINVFEWGETACSIRALHLR